MFELSLTSLFNHSFLRLSDISDVIGIQAPQGDPAYLPEFVEGIDIHSDAEDFSKDPIWDKMLHVPLQHVNYEPPLHENHIQSIIFELLNLTILC